MSMTLEQVRDWHRAREASFANSKSKLFSKEDARAKRKHRQMADAIDAHLAKTAQSVDVGAEDLQIEAFPPDPGGMRVYRPRGVKVTHKPTGITVACDHERSQHANRDTALRAITAALQEKGNG